MRKFTLYTILASTMLLLNAACSKQDESAKQKTSSQSATALAAETADTVYTNGKIYTVNEKQPWAEAVAIKDSKFLVVGSNADVKAVTGNGTKVVDLGGRLALPGFVDSHTHPLAGAEGWAGFRIENPNDKDAILAQLKKYAKANPKLPAIRGEAWNLGVFENDSPRKELLDEVVSDRPVYLLSQTGHSAWANSKALELAGITKDTKQTDTFLFDTDPKTGVPSGTVREFGMGALERVIVRAGAETYANSLARVAAEFNQFGQTTVIPAEGAKSWMEGVRLLEEQGGLTLRLFPAWDWRTSHYLASTVEEADANVANWKEFASDLIYPRYVKLFYDGGPDSYTALLLEDYEGRPGFKGSSNMPRAEAKAVIKRFNADGIGVLTHVLGDGGAQELAQIYAEVRAENGDNGVPLHFSHAWLARPDVFPLLAKLKYVCVDFSPVLAYPHPAIVGSMAKPLGEARYQKFFNVKAAFQSGVPIGFGSDWPSALIPDPNVMHQIQSWVTRIDPDNPKSGTLNADQAITVEQAVWGYTQGGAHCIGFGWEKKIGSIEKGKLADMVVLDRNIFEVPTNEIAKAVVERTLLGGKVVYDRPRDGEIEYINDEGFKPATRYK